ARGTRAAPSSSARQPTPVARPSRRRGAPSHRGSDGDAGQATSLNREEASGQQVVDERQQIGLQRLARRVELALHGVEHRPQRSMRFTQLPDPGADRVEAVIGAAGEIQDHGLSLQFAEENVVRYADDLSESSGHRESCDVMSSRMPWNAGKNTTASDGARYNNRTQCQHRFNADCESTPQ